MISRKFFCPRLENAIFYISWHWFNKFLLHLIEDNEYESLFESKWKCFNDVVRLLYIEIGRIGHLTLLVSESWPENPKNLDWHNDEWLQRFTFYLYNSTLLHNLWKFDEDITFQTYNNNWKFPNKCIKSDNLP